MALDFPNTPQVGDRFSSGSAVWQWDGTKWVNAGGIVGPTGPMGPAGGRNFIHNPIFNVQQRGVATWNTNGAYTADRWQIAFANDTLSTTLVAAADSDRTAIVDEAVSTLYQHTFTGSSTSGSYSIFLQKAESVRRLSGKQITISFWARATSGTPRIGVGYAQTFGSGGSPSAAVVGNIGVTPALSATWQRYSVSGTMPSAAGKTFGTTGGTDLTEFDFWLSDQAAHPGSGGIGVQSGTVQFWGMQLEQGGIATPLEKVDPQTDLANCQRFYLNVPSYVLIGGWQAAGGTIWATVLTFPVTMRAAPSVAFTSPGYQNASGLAVNNVTPVTLTVLIANSGGNYGYALSPITCSADL